MLKKIALTAAAVLFASNLMAAPAPHVVLDTSLGQIEIELNQDKAPISTKTFWPMPTRIFTPTPSSTA
jgi:peptidyl-prolyl cis-trans isomerase A (cyclophilin A)